MAQTHTVEVGRLVRVGGHPVERNCVVLRAAIEAGVWLGVTLRVTSAVSAGTLLDCGYEGRGRVSA